MKDRPGPSKKLNILALPNQTTTLFFLIVVVMLGSIMMGSWGSWGSQPFMWILVLGLLLLPARAFLAWPERELKKHNLSPASDAFARLAEGIKAESEALELPRTPKLVIGDGDVDLHVFGSLRHWYVAISRSEALRLQTDLEDEGRALAVHAMIIHELHHFKNGDYWQMGYARELLRTAAVFMLWAVAFLMGYGFFLLLVQPYVLQMDFAYLVDQTRTLPPGTQKFLLAMLPPEEAWADMQARAAEIHPGFVLAFIVNATMPFIIIGSILWLFYWRKLLRIREFYADAGVAQTQKSDRHLFYALLLRARATADVGDPSSWLHKFKLRVTHNLKRVASILTPPLFLRRWFSRHPDFLRRVRALEDPIQAYDSWLVTALSLGSLTLILDMLLSTPLMLPYHGQWPMHFSVLVISSVLTLTLMTPLVLGQSVWGRLLKSVAVIVVLRLGWIVLTIGFMLSLLLLAPQYLREVLGLIIIATSRQTSSLSGPIVDDLGTFVLEASLINVAQVFIILAALLLLTGINVLLLRRIFTWYGFPGGKRGLMKATYGTIVCSTVSFGLTVLTPATTALLKLVQPSRSFMGALVAAGVGCIIAAIGLGLFLRADRRYSRKCPVCGAHIHGAYELGKHCDDCGHLLHPWMLVEYE